MPHWLAREVIGPYADVAVLGPSTAHLKQSAKKKGLAHLRQGRSLCIDLNPYLCALARWHKGLRLVTKRASEPYPCTLFRRAVIHCTLSQTSILLELMPRSEAQNSALYHASPAREKH